MTYHTGKYFAVSGIKAFDPAICAGSGYYAGPLSVPHQYQSPTKYRTCSYCRSQAEIGKNCPNCGAPEMKERGRLIYD